MILPRSVLPVMDLRHGQVVHARAGERASYQPLVSRWTPQASDPLSLAAVLSESLGCREFYVADLDAIESTGDHRDVIQSLLKQGYRLWLDAGVNSIHEIDCWLSLGVHRVILASETITTLELLKHATKQCIFSLDLHQGRVQSLPGVFASQDTLAILTLVSQLGLEEFILLDTAGVGISQGCSTLELCRTVRAQIPGAHIITGGGVRSFEDIACLESAGADRVLVSTWLHSPTTTFAASPIA